MRDRLASTVSVGMALAMWYVLAVALEYALRQVTG